MKISEAIVRSTKNRKLCNIFLGCTVTIKQYAAPTRKMNAKKAETLENTGEIIDILKGAACHKTTAFHLKCGGFSNFSHHFAIPQNLL